MLVNVDDEKLHQAYHAMADDVAARYLNLGQMLAEQFPREAALSLCPPAGYSQILALKAIGELAPAGMCILHRFDRKIVWANKSYKKYFSDLENREVSAGLTIDEILPEFKASGLEDIFERVATTGEPYQSDSYPVETPNAGVTFWHWSLSPLPFKISAGGELLIQMYRVEAPAISLAA